MQPAGDSNSGLASASPQLYRLAQRRAAKDWSSIIININQVPYPQGRRQSWLATLGSSTWVIMCKTGARSCCSYRKNVEVLANQHETPPSSSQNTKSVEMPTMQCRNSGESSLSRHSSTSKQYLSSNSSSSSSSSKSSSSSTPKHAASPDVLDSDDSVADKNYEPNYDEDSEGVDSNDNDSSLNQNFDAATLGNSDAATLGNSDAVTLGNSDAVTLGNSDAATLGNSDAATLGNKVTKELESPAKRGSKILEETT
ncbi:uncharacterized G-patch domain protein DDB_G0278987-like [Macrobrachium rosenbergii]|uniref:uncharacterized G-patch domain protein DDB_G0278987-like n=1 Tax=Macrobrachium rosenbergii TaxID=79674 RepID=UPI0034D55645